MEGFSETRAHVGLRRFLVGLLALLFLAGLLFVSQATIVATTDVTDMVGGAAGTWQEGERGLFAGLGGEQAAAARCRRHTRAVRVTGLYLGRPRLGKLLSRPGRADCRFEEWRVGNKLGSWGYTP